MKKILAILLAVMMLASLAACGKTGSGDGGATAADGTQTAAEQTDAQPGAAAADIASWTWAKSELDCYGYSTQDTDCYLSFSYPENFTSAENNDDGEQYRGFFYHPENPDATANESPYGIYAYFMQGGYGGHKTGFEEDLPNGFTERELGGRTVLFGELPSDENTGSHVFIYYVSFSEDDWARIWVLLTDPEADGVFRQTFEQSLRFVKE